MLMKPQLVLACGIAFLIQCTLEKNFRVVAGLIAGLLFQSLPT